MRRIVVFCSMACAALCAVAMPTKKEVAAARDVVAELMSDVVADQKAGKLTAAQVAEKALELAGRAETEAAKLLLIQGAVMGFARGGEPARAAEAMQRMKREIKDITPEYEADVLSRAVKTVPAKSGRLLYAMLDDTKRLVRYRRDIPVLEKKLAKMDTPEIRAQLAERLAATGDWKRALELFAKMDGDVARAAKFERGELPAMTASEVADIWWAQKGMKDSDGFTVFQRHAGEWYKKALADGSLKGLKRDLALKRLDGMGEGIENGGGDAGGPRPVAANEGAQGRARTQAAPQSGERPKPMAFDLGGGVKVEMMGCPAGTFMMGHHAPHKVTISRSFWVGKYPITREQWNKLMPEIPINQTEMALGGLKGAAGNISRRAADKFCQMLTEQFKRQLPAGFVFRLPTFAESEYFWRANSTDPNDPYTKPWHLSEDEKRQIGVGNEGKRDILRRKSVPIDEALLNHSGNNPSVEVGMRRPNAWGIYDLTGNVGEWLLDVFPASVSADAQWGVKPISGMEWKQNVDPLFWIDADFQVTSLFRASGSNQGGGFGWAERVLYAKPGAHWRSSGFRIVLGPDLIAEQAKKR